MEDFESLYKKYSFVLWPALSAAVSVLIVVLVIIPQAIAYLTTSGKITELQAKTDVFNAKAKELSEVDETTTRRNLEVAFFTLPVDPQVAQAMLLIQNLVNKAGLTLKDISFSSSRKSGNQSSFVFELTLLGPLPAMRNFLILLQSSSRVFEVQTIDAQFQQNGSGVEVTLPVAVYFDPTSKVSIGAEQPLAKLSDQDQALLDNLSKIASQESISTSSAAVGVPLGKPDPFQ